MRESLGEKVVQEIDEIISIKPAASKKDASGGDVAGAGGSMLEGGHAEGSARKVRKTASKGRGRGRGRGRAAVEQEDTQHTE